MRSGGRKSGSRYKGLLRQLITHPVDASGNAGSPLSLVAPPDPGDILYAHSPFGEGFELHLGKPWVEPPEMSIREFCLPFGDGNPEAWWRENWLDEVSLSLLQQRLNELGTGIEVRLYN